MKNIAKILKQEITVSKRGCKLIALLLTMMILYSGYDFINFYYTTRFGRNIIIGKRGYTKNKEYMVVIMEKYSSFPGHAYSLVEHSYDGGAMNGESISLGPIREKRKESLVKVQGTLHNDPFRPLGKGSNFTLLKMIDESQYHDISQYLTNLRQMEQHGELKYRLWDMNCIDTADTVAKKSGLITPTKFFKFPKDYVKQLVDLNAKDAWSDSYKSFAKPEFASPPIFLGKNSVFKSWIGSIFYRTYFLGRALGVVKPN